MRHTEDPLQRAIVAEVRAEIVRQGKTYGQVQEALGVASSTWAHWFTLRDRDIPMVALADIAAALGVRLSDLVERAENTIRSHE